MKEPPERSQSGCIRERAGIVDPDERPKQPLETPPQEGIMRLPEVIRFVGISKSTIYRLIRQKYFPAPVSLTDGHAVGWRRRDIRGWVDERRRR